MDATERKEHWQRIYSTKNDEELSWFQPDADVSLDLLLSPPLPRDASILDVGGGTSRLVDGLLDRGYRNVTVLDVSDAALRKSAARLGERASTVRWVPADITLWEPDQIYQAWHDRAVFHFLTDPADRRAYRTALYRALPPGGVLVLGTFALDGPERCSGLPVQRYSEETLAGELGDGFRWISGRNIDHRTPAGAVQRFQFSRWARR
jgi:SAM-dependent methyltransferase